MAQPPRRRHRRRHRRPDRGRGPAPARLGGHRPGAGRLARTGRRRHLPRPQLPARPGRDRPRRRDPRTGRLAGRRRLAHPVRPLALPHQRGGHGRTLRRARSSCCTAPHSSTTWPRGSPKAPCAQPLRRASSTRATPETPAMRPTGPRRPPDGELEAELVVGADGIHSAVRRALFPEHAGPRYSGFTTWRVVIPVPGAAFASHETWGRGRIWGTQPLKDGRVYAYAAAMVPAGGRAPDDEKCRTACGSSATGTTRSPPSSPPHAPKTSCATTSTTSPSPCPPSTAGRVALLGDAAHAMPPTLGQGGNQAIEDAVVLAHHATPTAAGLRCVHSRPPAAYHRHRPPGRRRRPPQHDDAAVPASSCATPRSRWSPRPDPGLFLRSFDVIADWRPPRPPYASDRAHTP